MAAPIVPESALSDLFNVHHIPEAFPHLYNERSWCYAVKNRAELGISPAFKKVGKTMFVNIRVLAECINKSV